MAAFSGRSRSESTLKGIFLSFIAILAYKILSTYSGYRGYNVHSPLLLQKFVMVGVLSIATRVSATDVWGGPAFTADPATLREAAQAVEAGKHSDATVLL